MCLEQAWQQIVFNSLKVVPVKSTVYVISVVLLYNDKHLHVSIMHSHFCYTLKLSYGCTDKWNNVFSHVNSCMKNKSKLCFAWLAPISVCIEVTGQQILGFLFAQAVILIIPKYILHFCMK